MLKRLKKNHSNKLVNKRRINGKKKSFKEEM